MILEVFILFFNLDLRVMNQDIDKYSFVYCIYTELFSLCSLLTLKKRSKVYGRFEVTLFFVLFSLF